MSEENFNVEDEARRLIEREEAMMTQVQEVSNEPAKSLGKVKQFAIDDDSPLAAEVGWKNVPIDYLPSGGMFYPEGTQVAIRAACLVAF